MKHVNNEKTNWLSHSRPVHRFLIGLVVGIAVFVGIPENFPLVFNLLVGWLGFCMVYIVTNWFILTTMSPLFIKIHANEEDGSKVFVFALVLLSAFASMFAVLILIMNKHAMHQQVLVPVALTSMVCSWFMVHTVFVFHYAHKYYWEGTKTRGLDFPGTKDADYLDFAYFSFGVGCTFQVADVSISSKAIRRIVFFHSLLSFFLNTFVVALTINIIAGLLP